MDFQGGKNVGFYLNISYFTLSNFFSVCFKYCKKTMLLTIWLSLCSIYPTYNTKNLCKMNYPLVFPILNPHNLLNIWFSVYGFYINFESFFMLFPTIQKIFTFLEKFFYLLGGLMTSSRDHQNYKNVTIVFFFITFP